MMLNPRSIYYTTYPEEDTQISVENIIDLKNVLKDFTLMPLNDHFAFVYKNLNIIISNNGHMQFSLISTQELSDDLNLLAKFAFKVNSIIGIKNYTKKLLRE